MRAIILDGNQKSALAVTRSLGQRGIETDVGSETVPTLSTCSRYCRRPFSYPSPYRNPDAFIEFIRHYATECGEAVLFPMTDITMNEVLRNKREFSENITIPFESYRTYSTLTDKISLFRLAGALDIPIPRSLLSPEFNSRQSLLREAAALGFPLVIKPVQSKIKAQNGWFHATVRYANDSRELEEILDQEPFNAFPFILQERITGPGIGIFLLTAQGSVLARFAHRRVREKPPSGGVSVVCESIIPPKEVVQAAARLLEEVNWSGVAMVEFKWDRHSRSAKLMEVNARFWGSLQLAVSSGVDFPYLLFCLAQGQRVYPVTTYKVGLLSRWELGDLDHMLMRLRKKPAQLSLPYDAPARWRVPVDFAADFFNPSVRHEILRPDDPGPFLFEVKQYVKSYKIF